MFRLGCLSGSFDTKNISVKEDDKTGHDRIKDNINIIKVLIFYNIISLMYN